MLARVLHLVLLLLLATGGAAQARDNFPGATQRAATISVAALPPEARQTLQLIHQGGPFPYRRDGITFQNRERRLPQRAEGYYQEYTVITPGSRDRGARRIISGGQPPTVFYYTDDHYRSFKRIQE